MNGGHNDAVVGLGLLVAVLSPPAPLRVGRMRGRGHGAREVHRRPGAPSLDRMGVPGGRWPAARRVAAAPLLVAMPVMLVTPGMMHSLSTAKTDVITRTSIWNVPLRLLPYWLPRDTRVTGSLLILAALAIVGVLAVRTGWIAQRMKDPADGVVAATAVWLIFGAYTLPWYTVWSLPTAALLGRGRLKWLVAVRGPRRLHSWCRGHGSRRAARRARSCTSWCRWYW